MKAKTLKYSELKMIVVRKPAYKSTYPKVEVQWLNKALSIVTSFCIGIHFRATKFACSQNLKTFNIHTLRDESSISF